MVASQTIARRSETERPVDFDAVVIGAGVSGLYQLYRLRELGLTVRVFEAGTGVGGTGCGTAARDARFDSESWTYGYSFLPGTARRVGLGGATFRPASPRPSVT